MSEIKFLKNRVEPWEKLVVDLEDLEALYELAAEDGSLESELVDSIESLSQRFDKLNILNLLSDEVDRNGAFLTIHAGAGGTEACDWAAMLLRMYTRWTERRNFKVETVDILEAEGGIKSVTLFSSSL